MHSTSGFATVAVNNPRGHLGLLALAQRNAYVAQTSIADPVHLGESMLQALDYQGPALLQVYAPSPLRHGFISKQTLAQAQLAVASRTLPLFRYDPGAEGVFGSRISLDGNPAPEQSLAQDDDERPLTLADWALGQERFASQFEPLADDAASPTPLHDWLQLDAKGRKGKTPCVATGDGEEEQRFAVSQALADTADQCLANWQTLQELAGIVTPFTERLEQEIRASWPTSTRPHSMPRNRPRQQRSAKSRRKRRLKLRATSAAACCSWHRRSGTDSDESFQLFAAQLRARSPSGSSQAANRRSADSARAVWQALRHAAGTAYRCAGQSRSDRRRACQTRSTDRGTGRLCIDRPAQPGYGHDQGDW